MKKKIRPQKKNTITEKKSDVNNPLVYKYSIPIILFFITLFVLLLINRPSLFMNDEIIAVNQLHQLSLGHQTLINECKYGCYPNGTPSEYFEMRSNILGYNLFLPIISLPAFLFFSIFGDQFRLPVILLWSFIPLLISVIITSGYQHYSRMYKIPILYIGGLLSIFLVMINLYYYHPFPFSALDAPSESGAIILTNTIIGSFFSVIIYQISQLIWNSKKISLLCTLSIMSCSSYLFWSGTAKDHILMTLMVMLTTYFFIGFISKENKKNLYIAFFFIGLLAWVRPEMGLSIFAGALIFLFLEWMSRKDSPKNISQIISRFILCVIATIAGAIPLFINNLITTKNIFIPAFYYYLIEVPSQKLTNLSPGITENLFQEASGIGTTNADIQSIFHIPSLIYSYFSSTSPIQVSTYLIQILFHPESGNMSIAAVTPLFISGLIILIGYTIWKRPKFERKELLVLLCLSIFIVFSFIAYTKSLPSISKSNGIIPDMRYFLPIYFLGGIIGFYPIAKWTEKTIITMTKKIYVGLVFLLALGVTISIVILFPGADYHEYTAIYMPLIYGATIIFIFTYFAWKHNYCSPFWICIFYIIMISLPLSWQFMMDLFYSVGKLHGYPFWMPYIEYLIEKYVHYQII